MTADTRIVQQTRLIRNAARRLASARTDTERNLWLCCIDTSVREIKVAATGDTSHYEG